MGYNIEVTTTDKPHHPAVRRCLRLMEENLKEPWSANALAERLHINVSYLGRLFKSSQGISPLAFLALIRLNQAAHLLKKTNRRVSEIGKEVGLSDANYFARRFRSHFGVSAREYRKRQNQTF